MRAIEFDEQKHKYTRGNAEYISVTTLIKRYEQEFDTQYWSTYKAVKDVFSKYGKFSKFKWQVGGWENVVDEYNRMGQRGPYLSEVMERKQFYIAEWERVGAEARDKGNVVHNALEDEINGSVFQTYEDGSILIPSSSSPMHDPLAVEKDAIIAEAIVFNDRFHVAGKVDKIEKKGMVLDITDHKTSKEITKIAFMDKTLKHPVSHLPNANYFVYSLQLSLYAWMFEQFGYSIRRLTIAHRSRETGELIEMYPVSYLKREIELILTHYGSTQ